MAAFARTELDLVGLARQDNQAAIQLFVIRDGKMIGRDVFLLDAVQEASDDEVLTSFLEQYYTRAGSIPREVYVPSPTLEAAALEAFLAERRGGPVHLRVPQRGEKRELLALATRNATETLAREQARWLADQGKTLAALEELAEALGLRRSAAPDRVLRHQQLPGQRIGRQHGRVRGRQAAIRRVPPVPDQDGRPARTTSPATRRCSAAGSAPSGPARRGARRSVAGRCRTWSSSTAARARSAPARRPSTSSVCTTCRWPAWPRSARSSSCPIGADPIVLPRDVAGALSRPAAPRRGAPLRDHLPPRAARAARRPLGLRRPARRRTEAQARAAQGLRLDQARPRRAGRTDRGGARASAHRWRRGSRRRWTRKLPRRSERLGSARCGDVPCNIPPRCVEPVPS